MSCIVFIAQKMAKVSPEGGEESGGSPSGKDSVSLRQFNEVRSEVLRLARGEYLDDRDTDMVISLEDWITYNIENAFSAIPNFQFYLLGGFTVVLVLILAGLWEVQHAGTLQYNDALWLTFQVVASAGFTNDYTVPLDRLLYAVMLFSGLVVFAILVGFITEAITEFMQALNAGETKVAASALTLTPAATPDDSPLARSLRGAIPSSWVGTSPRRAWCARWPSSVEPIASRMRHGSATCFPGSE